MILRVKGPRVLVQPRPEPEPDPDELIARPEAFLRTPPVTMGKVIQLGDPPVCPHCQKGRLFEVEVGDMICFAPSAGELIYVDDDKYLILNAVDVAAILERKVA